MTIGEKLKTARLEIKMTQEDLALAINVSRQTISNWENNKSFPDIASVVMLSDIYNISLDLLLKGDQGMLENLKETTDIVKSNKQTILTLWGWGLFYVMFYSLVVVLKQKNSNLTIANPLVNILFLIIFMFILTFFLLRYIKIEQKKIIEKTKKYKALIIISIMYVLVVMLTFTLGQTLASRFGIIYQQETKIIIRVILLLFIGSLFSIIYKKIKICDSKRRK